MLNGPVVFYLSWFAPVRCEAPSLLGASQGLAKGHEATTLGEIASKPPIKIADRLPQ
jgi:hypothetical protein